MTDPITPPPELRCQWQSESPFRVISVEREDYMIDRAAQWGADQQKIRSRPESPLVERVADAIAAQATSAGIVNDRPARAAILEVAKWLAEQSISVTGQAWAAQLEIEAEG